MFGKWEMIYVLVEMLIKIYFFWICLIDIIVGVLKFGLM